MSTRYHLITDIMIAQGSTYKYSLKDLKLMSIKKLRQILKELQSV